MTQKNKEVTTKVNYELAGFDGPVGILANLGEGDFKIKSISVVQDGHRATREVGLTFPLGSFIDSDSFEVLGTGYGNEKFPADGIKVVFLHVDKVWNVFEKEADGSKGNWIRSEFWTPANAALPKMREHADHICNMTYRYLVKVLGRDEALPWKFNLKGVATNFILDMNRIASEYAAKQKRSSLSYALHLKTKLVPTKVGEKFSPYIEAIEDLDEPTFLECVRLYAGVQSVVSKLNEEPQTAEDVEPIRAETVSRFNQAFSSPDTDLEIGEFEV